MKTTILVRAILIAFIASLPACIVTTGPGAAHHGNRHHKKRKRRRARKAKKAQAAAQPAAAPAPAPVQKAPATGPSTAPASAAQTGPSQAAVTPAAPKTTARTVANQKQWELLGERKVMFRGDHDVIPVKGRAGGNGFRALRVAVKGSPLEMFKMKITFGNNQTQSPKLRHLFKQGSWTRRIDLKGNVRNIKKVEFWYRSVGRHSGRATVKLFGQR